MRYSGNQSLDAEINIDFVKGNMTMDYSLNKFGMLGASNNSCVLQHTRNMSDLRCLTAYFIYTIIRVVSFFPCAIFGLILTYHNNFVDKYIPNVQEYWQRYLKWILSIENGIVEEIALGKQESSKLVFLTPNNIYYDYELDGDYKDKVKSISLLRRFVKISTLGNTSFRQRGWNFIFEFTSPPQHGYCILRHT